LRDRYARILALVSVICLALLLVSCAGASVVARAGLLPPLDLQIETSAYHVLLVHNGPTVSCVPRSLRDSCVHRRVSNEFYIHYITPDGDRLLVWFPILDP
jgi:hypothetical protein